MTIEQLRLEYDRLLALKPIGTTMSICVAMAMKSPGEALMEFSVTLRSIDVPVMVAASAGSLDEAMGAAAEKLMHLCRAGEPAPVDPPAMPVSFNPPEGNPDRLLTPSLN